MKNILKYIGFKGRTNRMGFLGYLLIGPLLSILIGSILGNNILGLNEAYTDSIIMFILIYSLLIVTTRRLHDINESGKKSILILVPLINIYILFLCLSKKGEISDNKYGLNPLKQKVNYKIPIAIKIILYIIFITLLYYIYKKIS